MHGTRTRPPLVGRCCELPCVRRSGLLPLFLLLLSARLVAPERVVVRWSRVKRR